MYWQTEWTSIFHCFQVMDAFLMCCYLLVVTPRCRQHFKSIMHFRKSLVGLSCGKQKLKYSSTRSPPVMLLFFCLQHYERTRRKKKVKMRETMKYTSTDLKKKVHPKCIAIELLINISWQIEETKFSYSGKRM